MNCTGSPRSAWTLPRTQEKVLKALDGLPYEITLGKDTTSVTAVLRGQAPGTHGDAARRVLLRADMDGLPVQEKTGVGLHLHGSTAPCTPAATTCTPPCWPEPPPSWPNAGTSWPATSS